LESETFSPLLGTNFFISIGCSVAAKADVEFTFPVESEVEEELRLVFKWRPKYMSDLATVLDYEGYEQDDSLHPTTKPEVLLFALPHHQERMRPVDGSSNAVQASGCIPTIHGLACPVRLPCYFEFWQEQASYHLFHRRWVLPGLW
jgi:hypothetical protein